MPGDKLGGRMSIQILDSALVSQIAAGEIIERPASIVKELVENSLDAGAKSLYIAVEEGGIRTIRVTDDGVGIAREELGLAVTPHATSKLSGAAGLETITGFGFRGEALASIAQVARVSLTSRTPDADSAWKIMLEPGLAGAPPAPAAHPSGTSVEVSQLFFSVPARRKFLRRPATEFAHIAEVVRRLALANPAVGFCLEHDGRPVIEVSPATSALRFRQIIGQRPTADFLDLDSRIGPLHIYGHIERPTAADSRGQPQYLYVNGRWIRDRVVSHALEQAYRDVLFHGRKPAWVLFLELSPERVDVNVHPMKHEVRFREPRAVHEAVYESIKAGLARTRAKVVVTESAHSSLYTNRSGTATRDINFDWTRLAESANRYVSEPVPMARAREFQSASRAEPPALPDFSHEHPLGRVLGQIGTLYLVTETAHGLAIIDAHAAHERVLYERLKRGQRAGDAVQRLLVPVEVRLDAAAVEHLLEARTVLESLGFELDRITPDAVAVRSVPALLSHLSPAELVEDLVAVLEREGSAETMVDLAADRVLADFACRAAIRSGRRLDPEEMEALVRQMETTPRADQCNHGRPSWVELNLEALDRLFRRGR